MATSRTRAGIAYDRAGPPGEVPVVFLHAGVADRRMWDPQWPALTAERDVLRLDLRGYGESVVRPRGALSRLVMYSTRWQSWGLGGATWSVPLLAPALPLRSR